MLGNYCPNISMDTTFVNKENNETSEQCTFVLNLSQRLDLRSSNKHLTLQNLSIFYNWKNIRQQYKNNKLKIKAPTWNDEFELPDGSYSMSDIQDYINFIIKKHNTLPANPSIHIYIYRTDNRLVCKIKAGYKLEFQKPKIMKLFGSSKKLIGKTKNEGNVPSFEVPEVVLVHCNLVDNQYQQKSEVLRCYALLCLINLTLIC